jgi:hypothetical protein
MTTDIITLRRQPALNTRTTGPLLSKAQITLKDMHRTPAVFVQAKTDDSQALRQRIEQFEAQILQMRADHAAQIEQLKAEHKEASARRLRLQDATTASGSPEFLDGPCVPILSLRTWFRNREPRKPGLLRRWYLRHWLK